MQKVTALANKRKIYVINPKFQYKFCFIISSLVFITSLIYPITINDLFNHFIALNPGEAKQHGELKEQLIFYLALYQGLFIAFVFIFSIFISHKIAGPLYKLTQHLRNIRDTGEISKLTFRDGDNFPEIAEEINKTINFLADKSDEEIQTLTELSQYLDNLALVIPEDKKPVLEAAQHKIKDFTGQA